MARTWTSVVFVRTVTAVGVVCLTASSAAPQATRAEQIAQQKADKAAAQSQPHTLEGGDRILRKAKGFLLPEPPAVKLLLVGFRPGAGLGPGIAYIAPVGPKALWTTKAGWSLNNFKLAESALDLSGLARDRLDLRAFARWEDAPRLAFFGVGDGTKTGDEVSYALRSTEVGLDAQVRPVRWFRLGAGVQYLGVTSGNGTGRHPSIGRTFTPDAAPGLGSRPAWLHSAASAAIDWRESPGYTRRGGLYQVTFHDYADRDGRYSFSRTEIDFRQFIPLLHENWIIALQSRAELADTAGDQTIPYFMLPYIGGGGTLRGYREYRFTDRNSLLLRGELRWTATSVLDMAVFTDRGKVASRWQDLNLRGLNSGWGFGARFHGPNFMALRLEAGRSAEGWRYHVAQTVSF